MNESSLRAMVGQTGPKRHVPQEPRLEDEVQYQAMSFGRVGTRPLIMVEFRKADGYRLTIPYIDIKEIETLDPSKGFAVVTPKRKFVIEGLNLEHCYRYVKENRAADLFESDRAKALNAPTHDAIITSLKIQQNDPHIKAR